MYGARPDDRGARRAHSSDAGASTRDAAPPSLDDSGDSCRRGGVGPGWILRARVEEECRAPSGAPGPVLAKSIPTSTGEMLLVPAGNFQFGLAKEQVNLPAFYVDKTEVTNK